MILLIDQISDRLSQDQTKVSCKIKLKLGLLNLTLPDTAYNKLNNAAPSVINTQGSGGCVLLF